LGKLSVGGPIQPLAGMRNRKRYYIRMIIDVLLDDVERWVRSFIGRRFHQVFADLKFFWTEVVPAQTWLTSKANKNFDWGSKNIKICAS